MSADPSGIVVRYRRIVLWRARWAMKHHFWLLAFLSLLSSFERLRECTEHIGSEMTSMLKVTISLTSDTNQEISFME